MAMMPGRIIRPWEDSTNESEWKILEGELSTSRDENGHFTGKYYAYNMYSEEIEVRVLVRPIKER